MGFRLRKRVDNEEQLRRMSQRIRAHLDSAEVLRESVEQLLRALTPDRISIWLPVGGRLMRAAVGGSSLRVPPKNGPERSLQRAYSSRRTIARAGRVAAPIIAPRSGTLGVLMAEGTDVEGAAGLIEEMATEIGYALEAANLYEKAIAQRERAETILRRVGDAVVVTDNAGLIKGWNRSAEDTLGVPEAAAVGRTCSAVLGLHDDTGPLRCDQRCALLDRIRDGGADEVWRRHADGRRQPLLATAAPVVEGGLTSEIVHSFRDITKLKQADEAKTMFLATASHELKTPLTVIQGFAQLLGSGRVTEGPEQDEALDAIERRAKQLNMIVDRLLLSSRIEAGRAEVQLERMNIGPLLEKESRESSVAGGRRIRFTKQDEPVEVVADAQAVTVVLQHLLDNARKYSPEGSPVEVRVWNEANTVAFSVHDEGIGMDGEQVLQCFDKFWQAESTDVRRFGGTGIGLFIVRSMIEAMDGTIHVDTAPGRGATFTVRLRRADGMPEPAGNGTEIHSETPPEPSVIREFMRQLGIPSRK